MGKSKENDMKAEFIMKGFLGILKCWGLFHREKHANPLSLHPSRLLSSSQENCFRLQPYANNPLKGLGLRV